MKYIALILLAFSSPTLAEHVWKCTSPTGSVSFQNIPCFGSKSSNEELISIDPVNSVGVGTKTGERYRTTGQNTISNQSGIKQRSQGSNWNDMQTSSQPTQSSSESYNNNSSSLSGSCAGIEFQLEQIQDQMRAGYSAHKGERLKRERRNLKDSYNANCR
ncbi:MAG: hypothetical protein WEB02_05640 [Methylophaga sp.]